MVTKKDKPSTEAKTAAAKDDDAPVRTGDPRVDPANPGRQFTTAEAAVGMRSDADRQQDEDDAKTAADRADPGGLENLRKLDKSDDWASVGASFDEPKKTKGSAASTQDADPKSSGAATTGDTHA